MKPDEFAPLDSGNSLGFTPSFDAEVTVAPRSLPATCLPPGIPNAVGISVQNWLVTVEYVKGNEILPCFFQENVQIGFFFQLTRRNLSFTFASVPA